MQGTNRFLTNLAAEVCGYSSRLKAGLCPTCGQDPEPVTLRNQASKDEFLISGMCQTCQDTIFMRGE